MKKSSISPFLFPATVLFGIVIGVNGVACGQVDLFSHGVTAMATQPGERQIVSGKTEIKTDLDWVYHVAWRPDSKYFAAIGSKGSGDSEAYSVLIYEATSHRVVQILPIKKPGSIPGGIAFSPDGKYLAAGIGIITLWDAKTWQPVRDIEGPHERGFVGGAVNSLAFSPDSKFLAVLYESVAWPETIIIRTREDATVWGKKEAASKRDHTYWEKLAKGEILNHLNAIMAFDVETKQRIFVQTTRPPAPENARSDRFSRVLAYTADGRYLLTSRVEHPVHGKLKPGEHNRYFTFLDFRDPQSGHIVKEMSELHAMGVTAMAVSPDGKYVATGTETLSKVSTLNPFTKSFDVIDNRDPVRLWDLASGEKVMEYGPLRGAINELVFIPDGSLLLSCQTDLEKKETLWVWDVTSGQLIQRIATPRSGHEFFGCAMSPNGRFVAFPVVGIIYLIGLQQ